MNCAKTAEPIEMSFWGMDSDRPKEPYIRLGPNPQENGQFFEGDRRVEGRPFFCDAAFRQNSSSIRLFA